MIPKGERQDDARSAGLPPSVSQSRRRPWVPGRVRPAPARGRSGWPARRPAGRCRAPRSDHPTRSQPSAPPGPHSRTAEPRRPPPHPRPATDLKVRGTTTSPAPTCPAPSWSRPAGHRDDRPRTSRHRHQALREPAPHRNVNAPSQHDPLSQSSWETEPRRTGEKHDHTTKIRPYVHVGPHAPCRDRHFRTR